MAIIAFNSCKEVKKSEVPETITELSIPEKIAFAHGYEHWKKVSEIKFTFNVDRDTTHFERSWIWDTRGNEVTRILQGDTVRYSRSALDSTLFDVDAGFINDKYWLLAPFNLIWDNNSYTYEYEEEAVSPMGQQTLQKLTIVYGGEGGYTPGDAYDIYFDKDYIIREWVFRKGDQENPSMITSWEGYTTMNGLLISQTHRRDDGTFVLSFTDVQVE